MFGVNSPHFNGITALIFFCGMGLLAPLPILSSISEEGEEATDGEDRYRVVEIEDHQQTGQSTTTPPTLVMGDTSDEATNPDHTMNELTPLGRGRRLSVDD
ncbi:hypothetical protein Pmar_PMAR017789 [Perkinsus marinus ATCC 50983]|uniref:Uncharacterized protein n=1 Tax=Perkinsus marinus (strain ATCC 50983 / TXsc) TaxID=423536 RepID=C5L401_PERM5|nr:hypothetical protein Pmar_PMAR017789 [Perkinsus marinus ATCC 50983]EER08730.1 hypothetical protein Pmar_PMAR017789 [Perkinsus marinus ATCC 50983]|eukprot:XP_002776914.1 hypothetical protein Pmar_PMAR017789 [Perkinsus marinus ATCC 50983]